jgi:hypothetical protein
MRTKILLLCLTFTAVACGTSSPEGFITTSTRIDCRFVRKCLRAVWNELDYDNLRDCVDDSLEVEVLPGTTAKDAFVNGCDDFDSSAARDCLAGKRKAVRQCDADAPSRSQERACANVCRRASASALFVDPRNADLALDLLEELEAEGVLD